MGELNFKATFTKSLMDIFVNFKKNFPKLLMVIFVLISILCFLLAWRNEAITVNVYSKTDVKNVNGTKITNVTTTVNAQNYFFTNYPENEIRLYPKLQMLNSSGLNTVENNLDSLKKWNISINYYEINYKFGEEDVVPPFKEVNPSKFIDFPIHSLSKTSMNVSWSFNSSLADEQDHPSIGFLGYTNEEVFDYISFDKWIPFSWYLVGKIGFYFIFLVAGLFISLNFIDKGQLSKNYEKLVDFKFEDYKNCTSDAKKEKEAMIEKLINFPKQIPDCIKISFDLSLRLFKIMVNDKFKENLDKIETKKCKLNPYWEERIKNKISKYSEVKIEDVKEHVPAAKTLLLITGFLTSIGITISFNVGAAIPLMYTLVMFYIFSNLGSTICCTGKKSEWIWLLVAIVFVVILFPDLLKLYRV